MRLMVLRTTSEKLTRAPVVISPASTTILSLTRVSAATREVLSCARMASRTTNNSNKPIPIPLSSHVHAIPAAAGGASTPAAAARSGRGTGLDGLSLLTALPEGLQAQPRRRGAERSSVASRRRRGGGQERDGSAGGLAAAARSGGRSRGRGEWMGAHGPRREAR